MNNTKTLTRKFEMVSENDTITFEYNGLIETGVVTGVFPNKFVIRYMTSYIDNNNFRSYYDMELWFYKTGTKTHFKHTHGNAIAITGTVN